VFWRNLLSPYSKENNVGTHLPNLTASYLEDFNLDFYVSLCSILFDSSSILDRFYYKISYLFKMQCILMNYYSQQFMFVAFSQIFLS
jgi:hypothetical protein